MPPENSGGTGNAVELAARFGYPTWMVERFCEFVPDAPAMLAELEKPPRRYIRVNTLRTQEEQLLKVMESKGFRLLKTDIPGCLEVVDEPYSAGASSEYLRGLYYLQDLSSQIPALVLSPEPGEVVVDCCAAPGGKTTQLATLMKNQGLLVAMEFREGRLSSLIANLERMGVLNCAVLHADTRKITELDLKPDVILLDAPCTGEGVIGRDPTRKTSRRLEDIIACSTAQKEMLDLAISALTPGGRLLYSTCSFAPEENELVVDAVLANHDVELGEIGWGEPGLKEFSNYEFDRRLSRARRFYPHIHGSQGFFIALFKKEES